MAIFSRSRGSPSPVFAETRTTFPTKGIEISLAKSHLLRTVIVGLSPHPNSSRSSFVTL